MFSRINLSKTFLAFALLCASSGYSVNRLSSEEERIAEKLAALEAKLEAGEVSEAEVSLFKARVAARTPRLLEPSLSESEQGVVRNLRQLVASDRASALSNLLLEITEDTTATFNFIAGGFYAERKDWDSAKAQYREAVRRFPTYFEAHKNLGIICVRTESWEEARSSLLLAYTLQESPNPDIAGLLGLCYAREYEWPTAEKYYEEALENSSNEDWKKGLVNALLSQDKHLEAIPYLEELYANEIQVKQIEAMGGRLVEAVDTAPEVISMSFDSKNTSEAGSIVVEFLVTTKGEAIDAKVIETTDLKFVEPTIAAIADSEWKPAILKDQPVSVRVRKRFDFGEKSE